MNTHRRNNSRMRTKDCRLVNCSLHTIEGLSFTTLCRVYDCIQVDEFLRQLADYKNDYADMAAEKLFTEMLHQLGCVALPARPRARYMVAR